MANFKECYKCPDRCADPNCHDTCKRHQDEKAEQAKITAEKIKEFKITEMKVDAVNHSKKYASTGHKRIRKKNEGI